MPISRRYSPEFAPGESCNIGLDYSTIIPPGVGITSAGLEIFTNTATPVNASADWIVGAVSVVGRTVYCRLGGGIAGKDYQLRWACSDTQGNVWPRTCLLLCAHTS